MNDMRKAAQAALAQPDQVAEVNSKSRLKRLASLREPNQPTTDGPTLPPSVNWAGPTQLYTADQMLAFRAEGVAQERERCAMVCEKEAGEEMSIWQRTCLYCADAIRKR